MNTERHDISIKTSEEEGFDIYILYHPSVCTRSATHDQQEEWSEVEIEGVYYDENNHKLSAEHMARLPFDKADLLDVREVDWTVETEDAKRKLEVAFCTPIGEDEWALFGFTQANGYSIRLKHGVPKVSDSDFASNPNWIHITVQEFLRLYNLIKP